MEAVKIVSDNRDVFKNLFMSNDIVDFLINAGFTDVKVKIEEGKSFNNLFAIAKKEQLL